MTDVHQTGSDVPEMDTRERLVHAAIDVFAEKGYGGTRVQDIARRAGFTAGALYVHFPSRTALLGEAIALEGGRIIAEIVVSLGSIVPGDGAVSRVLTEQTVAETSGIDRLLLDALALAGRDPDARTMLDSTLRGLQDTMEHVIGRAQAAGLVDPNLDVVALRTFFMAWILGLVVLRAVGLNEVDVAPMLEVISRITGGLQSEAPAN